MSDDRATGFSTERHAPTSAAPGGWLERQDGVERVLSPGLPRTRAVASGATVADRSVDRPAVGV